jgi:hypothetical protein
MDKIEHLDRNMGRWGFLRTGWWVVHISGIALLFWLGMWFGSAY